MDKCHYTFVQIHRMHNTESETQCELWTLGNYESMWVHSWQKLYILVRNVDTGGSSAHVGDGKYGKSLYVPLTFIINLSHFLK